MGRSRHILQLLACVAAGVVAARPGGAAEAAAAPGAQVRTIAYPDGGKYVGQVLGTERPGQGTHTSGSAMHKFRFQATSKCTFC